MGKTYIVTARTWAGDKYEGTSSRIIAGSETEALAYMEQLHPGYDDYFIAETL